jgi:hypothetical protein
VLGLKKASAVSWSTSSAIPTIQKGLEIKLGLKRIRVQNKIGNKANLKRILIITLVVPLTLNLTYSIAKISIGSFTGFRDFLLKILMKRYNVTIKIKITIKIMIQKWYYKGTKQK